MQNTYIQNLETLIRKSAVHIDLFCPGLIWCTLSVPPKPFLTKIQNSEKTRKKIVLLACKKFVKLQFLSSRISFHFFLIQFLSVVTKFSFQFLNSIFQGSIFFFQFLNLCQKWCTFQKLVGVVVFALVQGPEVIYHYFGLGTIPKSHQKMADTFRPIPT